jgi:hypothetical protein
MAIPRFGGWIARLSIRSAPGYGNLHLCASLGGAQGGTEGGYGALERSNLKTSDRDAKRVSKMALLGEMLNILDRAKRAKGF